MEKALAIQKEVQRILDTEHVYLVGGSVRDIVMGQTPKDYDFTTPLLPDEMVEKVKAAGRHTYEIGKQFGTIGFKVPVYEKGGYNDGVDTSYRESYEYVEVTTFRSEIYTSKSRKPEVSFVPNLDEDLSRRDFTMNAMVLKPNGSIYDPYGGKLDIYAKRLKTVGMPKDRIQEDPLRMLRAARFAGKYGFEIDPNFIGKARQLSKRIYDVSVERWVQEMDKMLTSKDREAGFLEMDKMGLLVRILPELKDILEMYPDFEGFAFFTRDKEYNVDEAWRNLLSWTGLPYIEKSDESRNKLTNYLNAGICHRLKFSNARTKVVLNKG